MVKIFGSHNMTVLYPNRWYNNVYYKETGNMEMLKPDS